MTAADDGPAMNAETEPINGVPIADVARTLGVPMPTLRSWELRYAIPPTTRASGRHRRYTADDLHALRLMRDEIARGKRASVAAQSVRSLLNLSGPAADFVERILEASRQSDPAAIRNELDSAAAAIGLANTFDDVLFPAMRQIGQWWESGRCDIDQERLTTETARAWLDGRAADAPSPVMRRPVILACGPSDLHTLGLEALAVLLRHRGRSCRLLGARTPVAALTTAVQATRAPAAVILSHLASGRQRALLSLAALAELRVEVFYAGNAFSSPRSRRGLPGHYLGDRLQDACDIIDTRLGDGPG